MVARRAPIVRMEFAGCDAIVFANWPDQPFPLLQFPHRFHLASHPAKYPGERSDESSSKANPRFVAPAHVLPFGGTPPASALRGLG